MLTKLSLFSGIGGDDLASEWAGIKTIAFVERDKYCQQVLRKHWPGIPIIGDVHEVTKERIACLMADTESQRLWNGEATDGRSQSKPDNGGEIRGGATTGCRSSTVSGIDIISGGFPCQPHSVAGKRKGSGDERDLWPEFRCIIGEIKPRWVVAENVPGLFSSDAGRFFGTILADLAALGYSVGWCTFGAVDVGAWHRRDRVFIVAYTEHDGRARSEANREYSGIQSEEPTRQIVHEHESQGRSDIRQNVADSFQSRLEGRTNNSTMPPSESRGLHVERCNPFTLCNSSIKGLPDWAGGEMGQPSPLTEFERPDGTTKEREIERNFRGVAHGVSRRVDRLRALGNAVVPQQIYPIYKAIATLEGI